MMWRYQHHGTYSEEYQADFCAAVVSKDRRYKQANKLVKLTHKRSIMAIKQQWLLLNYSTYCILHSKEIFIWFASWIQTFAIVFYALISFCWPVFHFGSCKPKHFIPGCQIMLFYQKPPGSHRYLQSFFWNRGHREITVILEPKKSVLGGEGVTRA